MLSWGSNVYYADPVGYDIYQRGEISIEDNKIILKEDNLKQENESEFKNTNIFYLSYRCEEGGEIFNKRKNSKENIILVKNHIIHDVKNNHGIYFYKKDKNKYVKYDDLPDSKNRIISCGYFDSSVDLQHKSADLSNYLMKNIDQFRELQTHNIYSTGGLIKIPGENNYKVCYVSKLELKFISCLMHILKSPKSRRKNIIILPKMSKSLVDSILETNLYENILLLHSLQQFNIHIFYIDSIDDLKKQLKFVAI